jgi:hypothetical protein
LSLSRIHCGSWSNGRVALVGDAVYAPVPVVRAGHQPRARRRLRARGRARPGRRSPRGVENYELQTRDFVTQNEKPAPSRLKGVRSSAQLWLQKRMLRLLPKLPGRDRIIDRVTVPVRIAANAIALADY